MNKQVLSPFDCDMCAMIEDITKQSVEVTASDTSIRLSWAQNGSDGNDTPEAHAGTITTNLERRIMKKKRNAILNISDIDTNTPTGKMLLMAIAKLTTESQTDKTPDEVLTQISKLVHSVYNEKTCKGCPLTEICPDVKMKNQQEPERKREYKKPEAFDVPTEVRAMADFIGEIFPGAKLEIHRVEMPRRKPRDKRRAKNKRNGGRRNETR